MRNENYGLDWAQRRLYKFDYFGNPDYSVKVNEEQFDRIISDFSNQNIESMNLKFKKLNHEKAIKSLTERSYGSACGLFKESDLKNMYRNWKKTYSIIKK